MKAVKSICAAGLCVGAVLLSGNAASGADEKPKPIELTYSIFFPATHQNTVLAADWAREIEKRTDGRVKITVFAGGTLTPADKCYDGVEKGISDIGMSVMGYTRGRFPLSEVIDLPLGYQSGVVATDLINAYYEKFQPKEFEAVKILYLHAHGPGFLHTKKPVTTQAELKGMKIRCTGLAAKIVTALGGTPVAMPMGETYDALSRGVVDGSMAPIESLQGWSWGDVVKSTTECFGAAYSTAFFVAMNKAKWNTLPPDIQQTIEQVSREWIANTVIALTPEENAKWAQAVQPILDEYVKNMKEKGLPGAEALSFCQDFLKQNTK